VQIQLILIFNGGDRRTVGDYQNVLFLEALRTMKLKGVPMIFVHVVYLPTPKTSGEMKSKPAQHSSRELNSVGIQADFIVCRASEPVDDVRKDKLSLFCNVKPEDVISCKTLIQYMMFLFCLYLRSLMRRYPEFGVKPKIFNGEMKKWRNL
jgi:CTP synthase